MEICSDFNWFEIMICSAYLKKAKDFLKKVKKFFRIVKNGRQARLAEVNQGNLCIVKSILICVTFAVGGYTEGSKEDL